ncbi:cell wall-binding repeat-containing protein [Faecalimicrobium sp. JNUCC 81]
MRNKIAKKITTLLMTIAICLVSIPISFADSPKGYVTISVEKFTLGQGYIKDPVKVPFYEGQSVAHLIDKLLGGKDNYTNTGSIGDTSGTVETGFYLASVKDGFDGSEKTNIPKYILDEIEKDGNSVEYERSEPEFLGEFDYTNMSGWMYCVNNWFPNYGSSVCWPKDGDVIRWQFTTYGYGMDIGANGFGAGKPYVDIANKDLLTKEVAEINSSSDKSKILSNTQVKNAYDKAYKVLEKVDSSQIEVNNSLEQLNDALNADPEPPVTPDIKPPVRPNPPEVKPEEVKEEKIIGNTRYETAVKVSKSGWDSANNVVIVNGDKLPDALAATPFAKQKDAPILLTNTDKLNKETKAELERLQAKNAFIIGGENVVSKAVKSELEKMGIKVDRISGSTRFETSLEIAKKISNVSEIAVVNGEKGLSDATSIAAVAANKNMPIVLMPNKGTNIYDQFIKDNNIQKTYIIGQTGVISTEIESKLPNSERIGGLDRNETNAKIIEKFYTSSKLDNMFVCKNGSIKQDQLIDALSVGVLAAKENSPVVIVGNSLSEYQKNVLKNKEVKKMTQIGGGCEKAFEDIKGLYKK